MKKLLAAAAFLMASAPALAADVAFSMSVGEPGFYGSIDISNYPRPRLVTAQPVIIQPVVGVAPPPVYMRVPPGHAKRWGKYCHEYRACARPVLFVTDDWYERTYVPQYREKHGKSGKGGKGHGEYAGGKGKGQGNGKGHGKD
jgi:hypothetical protein